MTLKFPPGMPSDFALRRVHQQDHFVVPQNELPALVNEYVELIGNSVTNEFCTCEWVIHPDDIDKEEGKRRLRKGEPSADCWIHSKQGYLLGFFTWLFKVRNAKQTEPTLEDHIEAASDMLSAAGIDPVTGKRYGEWKPEGVRNEPGITLADEPMMVVIGNADQMLEAARYLEALDKTKSETYKATFVGEHGPEMVPICNYKWPIDHVCTLTPGHKEIHVCPCGLGHEQDD